MFLLYFQAYREKMYGPHYVWIFLNSFNNKWWIPGAKESSACSDIEMKCQIQNHFSVYHTNLITTKERSFRYNNKVSAWDSMKINRYKTHCRCLGSYSYLRSVSCTKLHMRPNPNPKCAK